MRVYETRPISANEINTNVNEVSYSPASATWKRIYIVNRPKPTARNEILTSEQVLERERFNVDLLRVSIFYTEMNFEIFKKNNAML